MTDFKAKMHQIRFRLGFRSRFPLGELTALPRLILGPLRGRGGAGLEEGKGRGREGGGSGGEGKGRRAPKLLLIQGPSEPCYATGSVDGRLSAVLHQVVFR